MSFTPKRSKEELQAFTKLFLINELAAAGVRVPPTPPSIQSLITMHLERQDPNEKPVEGLRQRDFDELCSLTKGFIFQELRRVGVPGAGTAMNKIQLMELYLGVQETGLPSLKVRSREELESRKITRTDLVAELNRCGIKNLSTLSKAELVSLYLQKLDMSKANSQNGLSKANSQSQKSPKTPKKVVKTPKKLLSTEKEKNPVPNKFYQQASLEIYSDILSGLVNPVFLQQDLVTSFLETELTKVLGSTFQEFLEKHGDRIRVLGKQAFEDICDQLPTCSGLSEKAVDPVEIRGKLIEILQMTLAQMANEENYSWNGEINCYELQVQMV